jgi:hypothetical protein
VAVKGDWGTGSAAQRAITRQMCKQRARTPFRDVLTTGDNFYDPDGTATQANYVRPERCLIRSRSHRWRATWGNHDLAGSSTADVLGARRRFYTWRAGDTRFIALDSNRAYADDQREWLERQLDRATEDAVIVYFHHTPLSSGGFRGPDPTVQQNWMPLFARYDVTLVLSGHQHAYEHHQARGVDYVVTGGGGEVVYPCATTPATQLRCRSIHHFVLLKVEGGTVTVRAIDARGGTVDRFTIAA